MDSYIGMVICALAFLFLAALPYNFSYIEFGLVLFMMGVGGGMFGSPNSCSIMNSVPSEDRGVASGMMFTIMNTSLQLVWPYSSP
jgi:MFS family permease